MLEDHLYKTEYNLKHIDGVHQVKNSNNLKKNINNKAIIIANSDINFYKSNILNRILKLIIYLSKYLKESINDFMYFLKEKGIAPLYKGLSSAILISIIQNGLYFLFKIKFNNIINMYISKNTIFKSFLSNLLSGIISAIITNPLYIINMRMANNDNSTGNLELFLTIIKEEGLSGLFKGLCLSILLVSNPLIQYTIYDKISEMFLLKNKLISVKNNDLKTIIKDNSNSNDIQLYNYQIVLSTFIAKLITTIITYPITTLKTLSQSKLSNNNNNNNNNNNVSNGGQINNNNEIKDESNYFKKKRANDNKENNDNYNNLIKIIKKKGIFSLYNGFFSKIIGSEINGIVFMLIYERMNIHVKDILIKLLYLKVIGK